MPSRTVYVVTNAIALSFSWLSNIPLHTRATSSVSAHRHWGCFHISVTVNNAARSTGARTSSQMSVFVFFGYSHRSGMAGS